MSTRITPTKDVVFKIIFGSQANIDVLKSLIESVIGRTIQQVEILNPFVDLSGIQDKQTVFDVKAAAVFAGSTETYNIEIQVKNQDFFRNRSLYYWAQAYGTQLKRADSYQKLRKHICINFLSFVHFDHGKFLSKYVIQEEEDKSVLTDHLQLFFVQMPFSEYNKRNRSFPDHGTLLEKWVYFFMNGDQLSVQEASKLNPSIERAHKTLHEIEHNQALLIAINMREKDDLARVEYGKRLVLVEQIEEFAAEQGLELPNHLKDDLLRKEEESLKSFVKRLYSKQWDRDILRYEIEGFRKS